MTLNAIPDNRVVSHQTPTGFMSAADKAAHAEASWLSPAGREALRRAEAATQQITDDRFTAALNARGLAEYREYVNGVAA
jgi:hypothetical protein